MKTIKITFLIITLLVINLLSITPANPVHSQSSGTSYFVPYITSANQNNYTYRINAPYFSGSIDNIDTRSSETAITWFGQVNSTENYADIRTGYSDEGLWVYISSFDRYIWYNGTNPTPSTLKDWDGATLYISTIGNNGKAPIVGTYKFEATLSDWQTRSNYQAAYIGNGTNWQLSSNLAFSTVPGWRGYPNDAQGRDSRGWAITFKIPYTSINASVPSQGSVWGISMVLHDRDSQNGPVLADKVWPSTMQANQPNTWAQLHFGLAVFTPPAGQRTGQISIRQDSSTTVLDAAVGGTTPNLCPGDLNFIWNQWGSTNYGGVETINIQNQADIADWPCFAKYFITFPLNKIPANKSIKSATLVLHQQGQAGNSGESKPSLIQILTIGQDWSENTITWNNAPLPLENVSQSWVNGDVIGCGASGGIPWPCVARSWDLGYAVTKAYSSGQPLRIVLYEADSDYHSGKYFASSEVGDWNIDGRPTLNIEWTDR